MKIVINAGHCRGKDPGALGKYSQEADVTYHLSGLVEKYLLAANCEVMVVQEHNLGDVTRASNEWGADLFVSIHCNAYNKKARGMETFHYRGSKAGKRLAECIQAQLVKRIDTFDRGVKEAGFYVLRNTDCPAVLVETAFIDNEEDEQLLLKNTDCFARAIAVGITDYISTM